MRCLRSLTASICLALAACSGGTCGRPQEDSEITLMPFHNHEIAPAMANGVPIGLILDTGAAGLTVTPQAVADLKLPTHTIDLQTGGIGGTAYDQSADIEDLEVGGARVSGAAAIVAPLSNSGLNENPAYGLLGADLLTSWDLDLDAAHDKLTLYEPQQCTDPAPPWGGPSDTVDIPRALTGAAVQSADVTKGLVPESRRETAHNGEILFPVVLDGHPLIALLDSGAAGSLVRSDAVGLDSATLADEPSGRVRGINLMAIEVHRHRFDHLVINGVDDGALTAAVGPMQIPGVDMLLGEDFLHRHRVYIAYHAGKLIIARSQ